MLFPGDGAAGELRPPLINKGLIEPAAKHLYSQESARCDAPDNAAQFIHVGIDHDVWPRASLRRQD